MSYSEPRGYEYQAVGYTNSNYLKVYVLDLRVSVFRCVRLGDVLGPRDCERVARRYRYSVWGYGGSRGFEDQAPGVYHLSPRKCVSRDADGVCLHTSLLLLASLNL